MSPRPFRRVEAGILVDFADYEQEVLTNLVGDLRHLLMADEHDTLRRLKPPAHADDPEAEAEYRTMIDDALLRGRLEMLDTIESGIAGTTLDDDGVAAWMQFLNNLRLVLGERLELEGVDLESQDLPEEPAAYLFDWTGQLLGVLVATASPEP